MMRLRVCSIVNDWMRAWSPKLRWSSLHFPAELGWNRNGVSLRRTLDAIVERVAGKFGRIFVATSKVAPPWVSEDWEKDCDLSRLVLTGVCTRTGINCRNLKLETLPRRFSRPVSATSTIRSFPHALSPLPR